VADVARVAEAVARLAPDTVVVIGPDHFHANFYDVMPPFVLQAPFSADHLGSGPGQGLAGGLLDCIGRRGLRGQGRQLVSGGGRRDRRVGAGPVRHRPKARWRPARCRLRGQPRR